MLDVGAWVFCLSFRFFCFSVAFEPPHNQIMGQLISHFFFSFPRLLDFSSEILVFNPPYCLRYSNRQSLDLALMCLRLGEQMGGEHIFQYPSGYGSYIFYLSYLTSRKAWLRGDQKDLASIPKTIPLRNTS